MGDRRAHWHMHEPAPQVTAVVVAETPAPEVGRSSWERVRVSRGQLPGVRAANAGSADRCNSTAARSCKRTGAGKGGARDAGASIVQDDAEERTVDLQPVVGLDEP